MKIVKRILKWIGIILGIWVLMFVAQMGWGYYREPIAKKQAKDFCATVKVGQSTEGISERAIASGAVRWLANWVPASDKSRVMYVAYIGLPPFSRHMCSIKATDVVISAEYVYTD
jgi:hypothetical protein